MNDEKLNDVQQNATKRAESRSVTPTTRAERNRLKAEKKEVTPKKTFWVQIRIIPIWLRIILVILLFAGAMALGLTIGYGYMGDGDPADALKKETWIHILDIIKGKES